MYVGCPERAPPPGNHPTFDFRSKKWQGDKIVYIMQPPNTRFPHPDHRTNTMSTSVPQPSDHPHPKKKKTHTKSKSDDVYSTGWFLLHIAIWKIKSSTTVRMKSCASCIYCSRTQRHGYDRKNYINIKILSMYTQLMPFSFLRVNCSVLWAGP